MSVRMEPGQGIGRDIGSGEAVKYELDAFISRRHEQRDVRGHPERAGRGEVGS